MPPASVTNLVQMREGNAAVDRPLVVRVEKF